MSSSSSPFDPSNFDINDTSLLQEALKHSSKEQQEPFTVITLHSLTKPLTPDFLSTLQATISDDPTADYLFSDGNGPLLSRYSPTKTSSGFTFTSKIYPCSSSSTEWVALSHLLHLTRLFPSVVASIRDSVDGEFILIETAEVIPEWLEPENSLNRLWVKNGKIVLLDGNVDSGLESRDALKRLKDDVKELGDDIRGIIEERIRSAKGEINTHRTAVVIPLKLAKIFRRDPGIGLKAAEKFCNMTVEERPKRLKRTVGEDGEYVIAGLELTRTLYGKIRYTIEGGPGLEFNGGGYEEERVGELEEYCSSEGYLKGAMEVGKRVAIGAEGLGEGWFGSFIEEASEGGWKDWKIPGRGDIDGDKWLDFDSLKDFDDKLKELSLSGQLPPPPPPGKVSSTSSLDKIASHMSNFVNADSDFSGVEVPKENVNIDPEKFLKILEMTMGEVGEGREGDGDLAGYFSEEEEGEEEDSDDEEGEGEGKETIRDVMNVMDEQVKGTRKKEEKEEVDIDVEVVSNLIESVMGEEGETGPASNILKSLGVDVSEFRE
ncbi:hypothetical protein TrVE_jg1871 [Triparma verrucosa]|uniref:Uncharacterized protein n=1 Tax=Triparma verrucosa TaxID=1606542 RepID=A0A9W7CGU7_9STRA|nr:hypothetical protein TrVE_jg1871 [Triparma verrucosa]